MNTPLTHLAAAALLVSLSLPAIADEQPGLPPVDALIAATLQPQSSLQQQAIIVADRNTASVQTISVQASTDKPSYAVGEAINLKVRSNQNAYVYLFNLDPSGQAVMLLPNAKDNNHYITGNATVNFPRADDRLPEFFADRAGTEVILVVASKQPINLQQVFNQTQQHYSLGSTQQLMALLAAASAGGAANAQLSSMQLNVPIYARGAAAVVPTPAPIATAPVLPVPVLSNSGMNSAMVSAAYGTTVLSTDKTNYRSRETMEVTYGSSGSGMLHLAVVHADGKLEVLKREKVSGKLLTTKLRAPANARQLVTWLAVSPQQHLNGSAYVAIPAGAVGVALQIEP